MSFAAGRDAYDTYRAEDYGSAPERSARSYDWTKPAADDFAAVCWWELWCLAWDTVGDQAALDLAFKRGVALCTSLETLRLEVAP